MKTLCASFARPQNYRVADILAFHRRDPLEVAERVDAEGFRKGLIWSGVPACLSVRFLVDRIDVRLAGERELADEAGFAARAERMLGLTQPVDAFEQRFAADALVGPLLARQSGLRVPLAATPFEALSWAITGQQISVAAAVALRRKLILAAGIRLRSGLLCYPDEREVAALGVSGLREAGFSGAKAAALVSLAERVAAGELPLADWSETMPVERIRGKLLAQRGIGPWTVDYALLRGFGWLDGSLHGDAAVRRALSGLLGRAVDEKQACDWLAGFSPWRALLAAHLWAMQAGRAD